MGSRPSSKSATGGVRMTRQRALIVSIAEKMHSAFTIEELAGRVRCAEPGIGVATVYRAVGALESSGWLERVGERDGCALFVRCDAGDAHHHHVVCTGCGRVEATECPLPSESAHGFVITRHDVTLYGLCPSCAPTRD